MGGGEWVIASWEEMGSTMGLPFSYFMYILRSWHK